MRAEAERYERHFQRSRSPKGAGNKNQYYLEAMWITKFERN